MKPRWVARGALPDCLLHDKIEPPLRGLWWVGRSLDELVPRVAIVGSRDATAYGLEVARALAAELAAAGVVVVSGMARGIDAAAHTGALSVPHGRTIAVLAGGVDVPYPRSSAKLYPRIVERGAVVSEETPGSDHRAELFLERNRIIAGLSLGVVLVQGDPRRSGALTTVRVAKELDRDVFGVPGDVRSVLSGGPHDLIFDGGHICRGATDVLSALELEIERARKQASPVPEGLTPSEIAVLEAINAGPARADELAARASLDVVTAARTLTRLELAGLAARGETGIFRRAR